MAFNRLDMRTRARDYLYEATADLFSDAMLNRFYVDETNSLPTKDIYLEEIWTTSTDPTQTDPKAYTLPTGTIKVELVERQDGTTSNPNWTVLSGCDNYGGVLYLSYTPTAVDTIRIHIRKGFNVVTDDSTAIDVPDSQSEVLVWGMVVRGYRALLGYLRGSQSWDSVTKPGDLSIGVIQNWLRDAKRTYEDLVQQHATVPRPRDIDLTG